MKLSILNPETKQMDCELRRAMHKQRAELFAGRLAWSDLTVINGEEHDEADLDPAVNYLITTDETGLVGSARLVPLAGQSLLNGPLARYLDAAVPANSPAWELTRFAPASDPKDPRHGRSFALLSSGVIAWALEAGVSHVFGIAEPDLMGIAASLGWAVRIEGPPVEYAPGKAAFAFSFPVDEATMASTCKAFRMDRVAFTPLHAIKGAAA